LEKIRFVIDPRRRIDQRSRARDEDVVSFCVLLVTSMNTLVRKPGVNTALGVAGESQRRSLISAQT
jgi:hypothetical protein